MPSSPLGRISAAGIGSDSGSNSAATDDSPGIARIASGPQNPCVRLAWGSASSSRTRRPWRASVPARWWQVEVLPTPPFLFRNAIVWATAWDPP